MSPLYRAIAKSMGAKYVAYAVQFLSLMVMARLFSPKEFGLVASIQVFFVFFQLLADGGLAPAIIGQEKLDIANRDGIFGLTLAIGVVLGLAFWVMTPAFVHFYAEPRIAIVVPYIALALIFNAWSILPNALLQRQQAFYQIAIASLAAETVALILVCLARSILEPLHALSLRLPIFAMINCVMIYAFSRATDFGQPRPGKYFAAVRPLLRVSGYQLSFNVINYFSRNLDNILVGRHMGPVALGVYDRSYQLMRYPLQLLAFAMTPAIQPVLRGHVSDIEYVRKLHLDLTFKLSLLGVICAVGMYFLAEPIILIAFGEQWMQSIPIIKILALTIPIQTVLATSGSFYQSFLRTDLLFRCSIFSASVNVAAIVWGVMQGSLQHLCWALLFSFHLSFIQSYWLMHKQIFRHGFSKFMLRMLPAEIAVVLLIFVAAAT